jgi:3-carboxy-cis,cis-muconate cycloisomerase
MLQVEAALAQAQARLGVIPAAAGAQIAAGAAALQPDFERLQAGTEKAGLPVVALVAQLRAQVGEEAAGYVHWGATSQDVVDTALVLQMRAGLALLEGRLARLSRALARLARRHRDTLMAARTRSQQALPMPFGLKVAGWLAPLLRHRQRLAQLRQRALVVQFGGAAGTLAALGDDGLAVQEALAAGLELAVPLMPWHTQRDTVAEVAGWLSLVSGSLAKMAQDVLLLAQTEVGEVRETAGRARGGSSTMPQKQNPVVSELILAAARSNAALLAAVHQAQVQEHERGTHGWEMEWLNLPPMFALSAAALEHALFLAENLVVDEARMQANVRASKALVREACRVVQAEGRHLVDVVAERTDAPVNWQALREEAGYFGSAGVFIGRVLGEVEEG